jgi:hypothetical protein
MAIRTLINRTTRKEFSTDGAEGIMKRYPRVFILKPLAELDSEILQNEDTIKESMGKVSNLLSVERPKSDELLKILKAKKRAELDELLRLKELEPSDYSNRGEAIKAIMNPA